MRLRDVLRPADLTKAQRFYRFDVGSIECSWGPSDGPSGRGAHAKSKGLFSDEGDITFDPADVPNPPNLDDPLVCEIVLHELVHIEQYKRGFFERLKMKLANKFTSYDKRKHEAEAYEKSRQYVANW